jgi:tetratricopeptide (TPR) repeat protein
LYWPALAATFALFAVASFLPEERLWGVNHLAFYSPHTRIVVLCVTGLFFLPPLATATWRALLWALRPFFRGLEDGVNALALSGVVSFVIFAAFRSSTRLLGDGYLIISDITAAAQNNVVLGGYFQQVALHERGYPATAFLNFAASWTASRFGASPAGGVWILNCAIGAAVVVGLLAAVRRTGWPDSTKLAVTALALFSGAVELFFGYVEYYTPALALGALYVLTALGVLRGAGRVWTPGLVLAAGALFHVQALLLAPSYLWLVATVTVSRSRPSVGRRTAVAVGILTVAAVVAAGLTPGLRRFFLPPIGADGVPGVFSVTHLLDVANEILLLCPAWLLFAALSIRRLGTRPRDPTAEHRNAAAFGWSLAVPAVLFLLLFRAELGMAREWDLYCYTVFGLAVPGLLALASDSSNPSRNDPSAAIVAPAVALCAALTISWVGVNSGVERSVARYRAILTYDRANAGYAYEKLARHYKENFQFARQIDALRRAYDSSHNPRLLYELGQVYHDTKDPAGAMRTLRAYLLQRPGDDDARKLLLGILARHNLVDDMIEVSLEGIDFSPRTPEYHFFLGNAYLAKGMTEEGLNAFTTCSKLNPPPVMVHEIRRLTDQVQSRKPGPDTR